MNQQPPWSFGFVSQTRGTSPARVGVGSRSPDGWYQIPYRPGATVGSCTSHPGVLGSIPKREEPGKTGAPCVKVPGSSRVPTPPWVGSSLVWVWVWVWDWIHSHTSLRTRSPASRYPPLTHYPFSPRSLVCGGQTSPHKPRLVVSHSTCPPLSSSPHTHSFVLGTAVINNNQIVLKCLK